jgi:hypothetical protein
MVTVGHNTKRPASRKEWVFLETSAAMPFIVHHGQGSVKVDWVERDPSPTALRFPLSPWRGIKIKIPTLSHGERGDRKAVGEGSTRA